MNYSEKKTFFDELAPQWEEMYDAQKLMRINTIFNNELSFLKSPVLDMGSGTGILLPEFYSHFNHNSFILELDISADMLKQAQKIHPVNGVKYTQSDGHYLPLKPESFNSVVCFQVFPHFYNKQTVMKEIFRILKPAGYLVILHLMGHRELNEMHRQAGHAVKKDRIISAEKMAEHLEAHSFLLNKTLERNDLYLVTAQKPSLL